MTVFSHLHVNVSIADIEHLATWSFMTLNVLEYPARDRGRFRPDGLVGGTHQVDEGEELPAAAVGLVSRHVQGAVVA